MRDYILLFVNGKEHKIRGRDVFQPLTDLLRYGQAACGTKVVCAEGDCGACTVLTGRLEGDSLKYRAVNGCIQYVYQLDCAHVITVEGLKVDGALNSVQEAMVDCHGAQCGYCTPGFVVAMCGLIDGKHKVDRAAIKEELTGNLCRCTGYESIIKAGLVAELAGEKDGERVFRADDRYQPAPLVAAFKKHLGEPVLIEAGERIFFAPVELSEAVKFKGEHAGTVIIAGGTDVSVNMNKRDFSPACVMSVANMKVPGFDEIKESGKVIEVGGRARLRDLEAFVKERIPEFYKILWIFGSPQIRSAGTLAGNIGNGSPIADTLPFLFVVDAEIEVSGQAGSRRIKMQSLYTGYKALSLKPDEIITRIFIPLPESDDLLKLYKVSRREHLDISTFAAAIRLKNKNGKIAAPAIAYGGVAAVVLRLPKTEAFLEGKEFSLDTFRQAGAIAREEITPISDVRGSAEFRLQLAENILSKFYYETAGERELVCR